MNFHIRSDYTSASDYFIDFERGSLYHSRATSRGQFNRLFNDANKSFTLNHLTPAQVCDFYAKNKTGELLLIYLRQKAVSELGRATIQASPCYLRNHQRVFDYPLNTLSYPISQGSEVGFVRSPLDRQKIVDYIDKEIRESLKYGQGPLIYQTREEQKNKVKQHLRAIAFAPPVEASQ